MISNVPYIQQKRLAYKPFSHPQYFEFFKEAIPTVWRPEEVDMNGDIKDFLVRSTDTERDIIQGILRGFTIMETHIADYWSTRPVQMFPKHEIVAACRAFSFFEAIHGAAYSHLSDCLGLNEYDAFLSDPVTKKKLDYFIDHNNDAVSIAVFSGAGEGVSLFSSFAVLLSLSRDNRYKGLAQIISWSVRDELSHSDMGCMLFRDLVNERGLTKEEERLIYEGFDTVLENEFDFIDQIFNGRELKNITSKALKEYMHIRANNRLLALGLNPAYPELAGGYEVKEWFESEASGQSSTDTFAQAVDGGNYTSLLCQDFTKFDYSNVDSSWSD
jgi:ribonucleoside-diphosphate reductase beta chain